MQLRFNKRARAEFLRLVDVFAEFAGPMSANKFIARVQACGESLMKYPTSGHPEPLLSSCRLLYRAKTINENYRMIYRVTQTTIWIVDIWDRRRDPLKLVKRIAP